MEIRRLALDAMDRLGSRLPPSPSIASPELGRRTGCRVWLKLENRQPTGSFKIRGVTNRLLALPSERRRSGAIAASTGNHGLALAHAAAELSMPALVFAPGTASPEKIAAIRRRGVEVRIVGEDCVEAEHAARRHASEHGMTYVSPYNDPLVVAGQATIGIELERQLGSIDAVVASLGGGGLIGGVGGYLKSSGRELRVIAGSPRNSPVMHASIRAGRILELATEPTLSDGTAGGVEPDAVTFDLCRRTIDQSRLIDERSIREAMDLIERLHGMAVEGAAGVAVAAFLEVAPTLRGRTVAIVICGGNR